MQVEAIYEQGRLEFSRPVRFKRDRVRLLIEVPDEEIVTEPRVGQNDAARACVLTPEVQALAEEMQERLDRIRAAPAPPDDELPEVSEKHLERMEAFAFREQARGERGK